MLEPPAGLLQPWMPEYWKHVRNSPNPPPLELAPPLLELKYALELWDKWDGMGSAAQRAAAVPAAPLRDAPLPRLVPEPPEVVAWGGDFVDLEWIVREIGLPYPGRPATFECAVEQVHVDGSSNLPRPCKHEENGQPRLITGRPGCACWGARVSRLVKHGEAYRFRVSARTHGTGWSQPGPWSNVFRLPRAPKTPSTPSVVEVEREMDAPSRDVGDSGMDPEPAALLRICWWVDTQDDNAAPLELVDCDVEQRAVLSSGLQAAAEQQSAQGLPASRRQLSRWELPHPINCAQKPWPMRSQHGIEAWECVARVPADPQPDNFGRFHALRFQFRVRARNLVGPGPWSAWSHPVSCQSAAAAGLASMNRPRPGRDRL